MTEFSMLGLDKALLNNVTRKGLTEPTPIQARAIPPVMEGRDLLGLAQTGTGKTLAFGLPMMHRLMGQGRVAPKTVRALILAPTRELVNQIAASLTEMAFNTPIKVVVVVGGASLNRQSERLARGADILVATPGRLLDLLDRHALTLGQTQMLVLDEADQMLDMGFIHALRKIARHLPQQRQTLLFSATMPKLMSEIAETYLDHPVRVQVAPPGQAAEKITQAVHFVSQGDKANVLADYLRKHPGEAALVFAKTKHGAEKLMKLLVSWGFSAASIHGNKSQGQRDKALAAFRADEIEILVATDVAARGLDIPQVAHVYNYELPNVAENYVHRIGRTARAGRSGQAVAFCAPAEMEDLREIEKLTRQRLDVIGGAAWPEDMARDARAAAKAKTAEAQRARSGRGGSGQGHGKPAGKPGAKAVTKSGPKPRHPAHDGGGRKPTGAQASRQRRKSRSAA